MMGTTGRSREADSAPSTAVIEALAAEEGCDPDQLTVPLYECVDPEALDAFVTSSGADRVTFTYPGYVVTVTEDGDVSLDPADGD